jgi:hypothetical protein
LQQYINFQPHFVADDGGDISADQIAILASITLGLLLVLLLVLMLWNAYLNSQLSDADTVNKSLSAQIDSVTKTLTNTSAQADEEIKQQINARNELLAKLQNDRSKERISFSSKMSGLGQKAINGLWLDRIKIDETGDRLTLEGKTIKAELVPRYLYDLSQEAVFKGLHFDMMKIQAADPENIVRGGEMSFEVFALPDAEEGVDHG